MVCSAGVDPFGWPCICHRRSTLPSSSVAHLREVFESSVAWQSRQGIAVDSKWYWLLFTLLVSGWWWWWWWWFWWWWWEMLSYTHWCNEHCLHGCSWLASYQHSCVIVLSPEMLTNKWITPHTSPPHRSDTDFLGFYLQGLRSDVAVSSSIEAQGQNQLRMKMSLSCHYLIWFATLTIPHISTSWPFPTSAVAFTVKNIHVES